jgi:hypothetical protein
MPFIDERTENPSASGWLDAEQPRRLGQRQPESRHLPELGFDPRAQLGLFTTCRTVTRGGDLCRQRHGDSFTNEPRCRDRYSDCQQAACLDSSSANGAQVASPR